jgi:MFS family permease
MNALMVVVMQFWLSRKLSKYRPLLMVAVGSLLYGIGYGMYGMTSTYLMFTIAMFIITIAEMIVDPLFQSLVASFAPEDMRGRYMAASALSWQVAYGGGPYLAGLFLDKANPNMWWATCAALGVISMLGFMILDKVHHLPAAEVTAQPVVTD